MAWGVTAAAPTRVDESSSIGKARPDCVSASWRRVVAASEKDGVARWRGLPIAAEDKRRRCGEGGGGAGRFSAGKHAGRLAMVNDR